MACPRMATEDGFELQLAVNHLGESYTSWDLVCLSVEISLKDDWNLIDFHLEIVTAVPICKKSVLE